MWLCTLSFIDFKKKKMSNNRQFESGASKRRRKNIQNNELKKYKRLMNNFVFINSEVELKAQDNPEIVVITNEENVCQSKNTQSSVEQKVQSNHGNIEIVNELNEQVNQINKNELMEIQGLNLLHHYPTDQAHFLGITLTSVIKRSIIEYGPCHVDQKLNFLAMKTKENFQ